MALDSNDKTSSERMKKAHIRYRKWFVDAFNGLSDEIDPLQQVQHQNIASFDLDDIEEKADPADYQPDEFHPQHLCFTETQEVRDDEGIKSTRYKCAWDDVTLPGQPFDDDTQEAIKKMSEMKLLERYEEPLSMSPSFEKVEEWETRYTGILRIR